MKTFFQFIAIVVVANTLSSCTSELSETVDQDKIFQIYELHYDKNSDKTFARATFTFSNGLGTKLQLSSSSQVTFNNDLLTFQPTIAYYEKEYAGFISSGTFKWTDTKGKVFTNPIAGIKPAALPNPIPAISLGKSNTIIWQGDALGSGERMVISMNSNLLTDLQIFQQTNINSTNIILGADLLGKLPVNKDVTTIIRRYLDVSAAQKTSVGATMFTHYQGSNATIQIVP